MSIRVISLVCNFGLDNGLLPFTIQASKWRQQSKNIAIFRPLSVVQSPKPMVYSTARQKNCMRVGSSYWCKCTPSLNTILQIEKKLWKCVTFVRLPPPELYFFSPQKYQLRDQSSEFFIPFILLKNGIKNVIEALDKELQH